LERLAETPPAGSSPASGCRDAERSGDQTATRIRHGSAVVGDEGREALWQLAHTWEREAAALRRAAAEWEKKNHVTQAACDRRNAAVNSEHAYQLLTLLGPPRPKSGADGDEPCAECTEISSRHPGSRTSSKSRETQTS